MTIHAMLGNHKRYIIEKYTSGTSMDKLGKEFGCNSGTIFYALKGWGVETRKKQKFTGKIEDYDEQMKAMYESGLGSVEISKKIGVSKPTILRRLRQITTVRECSADYDNLVKDKLLEIIEMFESGVNMNQISIRIGCSSASIYHLLKNNGYDTSKYKCKYTLNEDYFKVIDTHNKAYFLGWFYSDGNITKQGKCRITLQAEDHKVLEDLRNEIGYTGELIDIPAKNTSKPQICLNIDRQSVAQDLIKLGVVPAKSNILTFPSYEQVPEEFIWSFVAGTWDGDGSISIKRKDSISIGMASTEDFCDSLNELLIKNGILGAKFYRRRPNKPCGSLMFGQKEECVKFLNLIYSGGTIRLQRKYQKALPFIRPELQVF